MRGRTHLGGYALDQLFLGQFKELYHLTARDRRVVLKKFIDGGSTLDIVEEVLDGNTGSLEARCPAYPFPINPNHFAELGFLICCHISKLRESVQARKREVTRVCRPNHTVAACPHPSVRSPAISKP